MNLLSVENLGKSYGDRVLFQNVTFGLQKGDKCALVAKNGTGKSTLFQILLDPALADEGRVVFRDGLRIGFLNQSIQLDPSLSVEQAVLQTSGEKVSILREYERLLDTGDTEGEAFQNIMNKMETEDVWKLEGRMKEVLGSLKIHDHQQLIKDMSGGQQKRVALAAVLIDDPDVILLDEPTNHLDFDMIEWLEQYLSKPEFTVLLISHDRYFIDNVSNIIFEIDNQEFYTYQGDYAYYLEKKADREFNEERVADKARNLLRTELEWYRRMPKARTTKSKSRMEAVHDLKDRAKKVHKEKKIEINTKFSRLGSKIIELKNLGHEYGDLKILDKFDYVFKKGERIGIVGNNGTGKSTFLKILSGKITPQKGKVVIGETVNIGYYEQDGLNFKDGQKVIDILKEKAEIVQLRDGKTVSASQLLTQFHFPPDRQYTFVEKLSGGEKRRLYLLSILIQSPNFLILDEPTNDLDLVTLSTLEEYLLDFPGCLLVVSHDRSFLDRLCDHLFIFKGNAEIKDYNGLFSEYRMAAKKEKSNPPKEEAPKEKEVEPVKEKANKVSYKDKFEFEQVEKRIEELEGIKTTKEALIIEAGSDQEQLMKITEELVPILEELQQCYDRWDELAELF